MFVWFLAGILVGCVFGAGITITCLGLAYAAKKADKDSRRLLREKYKREAKEKVPTEASEHIIG